MKKSQIRSLEPGELHELRRWNTPTVYNGWEQITRRDVAREAFNLEPLQDFMPEMGPLVGYAVTVVIQPGSREHPQSNPGAWKAYRQYISSRPGPKVVVVQDLDKPSCFGAFWGEVNSSIHRALGCVGTITDGAIRDVDEMTGVGFKALARRVCVGHAYSHPVRWGVKVQVFGRNVEPGQLIHADKHGFLVISRGEECRLLDAVRFMDSLECRTLIEAARNQDGRPPVAFIDALQRAGEEFSRTARRRFNRKGEW